MAQPTVGKVVRYVPDRSTPNTFVPPDRARRARTVAGRAARATAHGTAVAGRATAHGTAVAGRATGRAAWKFRAELVPYLIGHALLLLTTAHHYVAGDAARQHAIAAYALPAAGAGALAYFAAQRPPGERSSAVIGAGSSAAVLLGWATWVVAAGPSLAAYVVMLVLATGLGVMYWRWLVERRNPRHVEVTLPGHLVPDAAPAADDPFKPLGLAGAAWLGDRDRTPSGYARTLVLPAGKDGRDVANGKGPALATLLDVGVDDVELLEDPRRATRVRVLVHTTDLLADPKPWPWVDREHTDLYDGVPLGLTRDGKASRLDLIERHLLIAGESGSGKSNVEAIIVAAAALDPLVSLWLIDGKVTELPMWRDRATAYVDDDPAAALDLLQNLRTVIAERQRILRDQRARKVQFGDGMGLIVLIVDELARFVLDATGDLGERFTVALLDVLQVGRSVGVIVVAATQRPSTKLLTGDLRAGFTYRLAMRMADADGSRMALGDGWGVNAATIDPECRGLGYLAAGTSRPRLMRAFYVPDEDLDTLTAAAAAVRPPDLPGVTVARTVADYDPDARRSAGTELELVDDAAPSEVATLQRRYPDGQPIRSEDLGLWDALTSYPQGATVEELQLHPSSGFRSRTPISDRLRAWQKGGYLERIEGKPLRWRRLDLDPGQVA